MSVIVGGASPDNPPAGTPLAGRSHTRWTMLVVGATALTVFGLVLLPSYRPATSQPSPGAFEDQIYKWILGV